MDERAPGVEVIVPEKKSVSGMGWGVLKIGGLALGLCLLSGCPRPIEEPTQPQGQGNEHIESFAQAKKHIYALAAASSKTFYCDCDFKKRRVDPTRCGYVPQKSNKRAKRTEIEHVVPAYAFGRGFVEWREGDTRCRDKNGRPFKGRNCARKASKIFRMMEADLFNLRPVIGELNAKRRHFSMAVLPGEAREFGQCDFEVVSRRVEPRPDIRGDIARTYFYMHWAYPGRGVLSKKQKQLFDAWSQSDPVDAAERAWADSISAIQGNRNPFVQGALESRGDP